MLHLEIKSLLGSRQKADELRLALKRWDPPVEFIEKKNEVNHYFIGQDVQALYKKIAPYINEHDLAELKKLAETGTSFFVRTKQENMNVILVVKAAFESDQAETSGTRIQLDLKTPALTLDELDTLILEAGFQYQTKWTREKETYQHQDMLISIDKISGYGYLAEFETEVEQPEAAAHAQTKLRYLLSQLNLRELPEDRLRRMFEYYTQHWEDYYGTDKTFEVE